MSRPSAGSTKDQRQNPYYFVIPPYITHSAGIRALHLTVHHLNLSGRLAFAAIYPSDATGKRVSGKLCTPELTSEIIDEHFSEGLTPIAVYPETIPGNPLGAPVVARHYLNFPGLLGGSTDVDVNEIGFGYSAQLARAVGAPDNVLYVPVVDAAVFSPQPSVARDITSFYAHKHKQQLRGQTFGLPAGCVEIGGGGRPDSPKPAEIADILRRSKRLYLFENSALGTEAVLCGCPVVLMYNEHFKAPLLLEEIGNNGFAVSDDPAAIQHAEQTIELARRNYLALCDRFPQQLQSFVQVTQAKANATGYSSKANLSGIRRGNAPSPGFKFAFYSSLLGIGMRSTWYRIPNRGLLGRRARSPLRNALRGE